MTPADRSRSRRDRRPGSPARGSGLGVMRRPPRAVASTLPAPTWQWGRPDGPARCRSVAGTRGSCQRGAVLSGFPGPVAWASALATRGGAQRVHPTTGGAGLHERAEPLGTGLGPLRAAHPRGRQPAVAHRLGFEELESPGRAERLGRPLVQRAVLLEGVDRRPVVPAAREGGLAGWPHAAL